MWANVAMASLLTLAARKYYLQVFLALPIENSWVCSYCWQQTLRMRFIQDSQPRHRQINQVGFSDEDTQGAQYFAQSK
jgi:hypothetical protein